MQGAKSIYDKNGQMRKILYLFLVIFSISVYADNNQMTNYRQPFYSQDATANILPVGQELDITWSDVNGNGFADATEYVSHYRQFNFTDNFTGFQDRLTYNDGDGAGNRNFQCTPLVDDFDGDGLVEMLFLGETNTLSMYGMNLTQNQFKLKDFFIIDSPKNFVACPVAFYNGTKKLIVARTYDEGGFAIFNVTNGEIILEKLMEMTDTCGSAQSVVCGIEPSNSRPFCVAIQGLGSGCAPPSTTNNQLVKLYLDDYTMINSTTTFATTGTAAQGPNGVRMAGRQKNSTTYEVSFMARDNLLTRFRRWDVGSMSQICVSTLTTSITAVPPNADDTFGGVSYIEYGRDEDSGSAGLVGTIQPTFNNGQLTALTLMQVDKNCGVIATKTLANQSINYTDVIVNDNVCEKIGNDNGIGVLYMNNEISRFACQKIGKNTISYIELGNSTFNNTWLGRTSYYSVYNDIIPTTPDLQNGDKVIYFFTSAGIYRIGADVQPLTTLSPNHVSGAIGTGYYPQQSGRSNPTQLIDDKRDIRVLPALFNTNDGRGIIFPIDFDQDGYMDIFIFNENGNNKAFLSQKENFLPNVTKYVGPCNPICRDLTYDFDVQLSDAEFNDINISVDCKSDGNYQSKVLFTTAFAPTGLAQFQCVYNETGFYTATFNVTDTFHVTSGTFFKKQFQVKNQNETCNPPASRCEETTLTQAQTIQNLNAKKPTLDFGQLSDDLTALACGDDWRNSFCAHGLWLFFITVLYLVMFVLFATHGMHNPIFYFFGTLPAHFVLIFATIKDYIPILYVVLVFFAMSVAFGTRFLRNRNERQEE